MSISKWWAEAKGMTWPSQEPVRNGAQNAGLFAMMSEYPMMSEAIEAVIEGGQAGIVRLILEMNFGEDGMGAAFVKGWNDYVREYRKCRQNPNGAGAYNFHGYSSLQANCLEHAKRYVEYQYPWPERAFDTGRVQGPREETWGYTRPTDATEEVVRATMPGSRPIPRVTRRRALWEQLPGPGPGLIIPANGGELAPETPEPEPQPVTSSFPLVWLAVPVALLLLTRT